MGVVLGCVPLLVPVPLLLEPLEPGAPTALFVFVESELLLLLPIELFVSRLMLRPLGYVVSRLEPNPVSRLRSFPAPPLF